MQSKPVQLLCQFQEPIFVKTLEIFSKYHSSYDKFTWTAMIVGLAINGHGEEALGIFSEMLRASTKPDEITYIGILCAFTHAGMMFLDIEEEDYESTLYRHSEKLALAFGLISSGPGLQ
ncbi:hypothetical protein CRYUN_Cryun34aG0092600 [Craigia yunnanensis]